MAAFPEVGDHSFNGTAAAAEIISHSFNRSEPVFFDEFKDIGKPLFVREIIHLISSRYKPEIENRSGDLLQPELVF